MTTPQNHRRCPASGCAVVVFDLVYRISGIGEETVHRQVDTDSDNAYACPGQDWPGCLCQRHKLGD